MSEYDSPQDRQNAKLAADTIDVLMRNLALAKVQLEGAQDDDFVLPDTMCTLIYAQPGTFCPLLYVHFPAETSSTEG